MVFMNFRQDQIQKFWSKVDKSGDCWIWTRSTAGGGYGTVNISYTNMPAHRVAWLISGKEIPDGFYVFQICRNRLCCNPEHMVCEKHYANFLRNSRFFSRVVKKKSGCWEWVGHRNGFGYGIILVDYKQKRAHRHSWEIHKGSIPSGLCVLHKCDNPPCVNPDHLFLGTQRENQHDMHSKKRNKQPKGEYSGMAVLTNKLVIKIRNMRKLGQTHRDIAKHIGVSCGAVAAVLSGRTWRHVK